MLVYESVKLRNPTLFPHSRLYHLEPVGIGTELVESLTGYVERLAIAHCVKTSKLCLHEILPMIRNAKLFQKEKKHKLIDRFFCENLYRKVPPINGMGTIAKDWVETIESITLNSNMYYLTALTWRNVISADSWLRPMRAWCPLCYQEQKNFSKTLYEQLLWTLRVVTTCMVHNCPLTMICPHCHKTQPIINTISSPGYCNKCQEWLGNSVYSKSKEVECNYNDFNDQLRIAKVLGNLFSNSPKLIPPPDRESVTNSINKVLKYFTNGNKSAFSRRFGISPIVLTMWLNGSYVPRISTLLKVCFLTDIEPLNFLQGNITFTEDKNNFRNGQQHLTK